MILHLLRTKIGAQDVGFGLFQRKGLVAQRFRDRAFSGDGLLHAQALGHLTEHDVPIEGVGIQVGAVRAFEQQHAGREYGTVELFTDDIVE